MTERTIVRYDGEDAVSLHPNGDPLPTGVGKGETFEIDSDVAELYDASELFTLEGPAPELSDEERLAADAEARPEPRTLDEIRAAVDVEPEELRGKALDDELRAASLSTSGTVAEKRTRLESWQAEQLGDTAPGDTDTNGPNA